MTDDELFNLIQDRFDYLDGAETSIAMFRLMNDPNNITNPVMELNELDRDLYFVHDVLWMTNSGGIGGWIHSHIDDEGWIDDAARAFKAIGHAKAGEDILKAKAFYDINVNRIEAMSSMEFNPFNSAIMSNEKQISTDLHKHLLDNDYSYDDEYDDDLPQKQ